MTFGATAESFQSPDSLRAAVASYLEQQAPSVKGKVRIEVGAIDPRLRLPACGTALQTALQNSANPVGNVTVGVRCAAPAWSVYVPARVQVHDKIAIVNRALARGAVLTQGDLEVVEQDVTRYAGGYFTDVGALVGKVLKRPVTAGTPVAANLIQEPQLVRRGERIVLLARTAGFEVRMEGEALEDGGRGEQIRTRNLRSKREVQGTVVAPGTVEVRL